MGCFLDCFGSSKDRKRRKQRNKVIPRYQKYGSQKPPQCTLSSEQDISEKPNHPKLELRDKPEEQLSLSSRKKVTFDSNVKTYEPVSVHESTDFLPESDKSSEKQKEESSAKLSQSQSVSETDSNYSITSSVGSYPPNHRYQNCRDSDDEVEELEDVDSALDDEELEEYDDYDEDGDDRIVDETEDVWTESIPAASMESSTVISSARVIEEEVDSPMTMSGLSEQQVKTIRSNRGARDRSVYVHPVLNPVENLSQWKAVKSQGTPPLKSDKENCIEDQEAAPRISYSLEPSFKQSSFEFKSRLDQSKNSKQEIAVDASLSNWLVSSETTPTKKTSSVGFETIASDITISQGSNSSRSLDDRPILGALTLEELKQFSASSSPRRSPSRSPDEMPIIGTVGTYWSHAGSAKDAGSASSYKCIPNTTRKYREVFVK